MRLMWLGFIFVLSLAIFAAGILLVEGTGLFGGGEKMYILFDSVEGLRNGDDVLYNGVRLGKVKSIERFEAKVLVTVEVEELLPLYGDPTQPEGYKISVGAASMLGGANIRIKPGDPVAGATTVFLERDLRDKPAKEEKTEDSTKEGREEKPKTKKKESTLAKIYLGEVKVDVFEQIGDAFSKFSGAADEIQQAAAKINEGPGFINRLIYDEEFSNSIDTFIENLETTSEDLKVVMGNVREGKGTIGKLFHDYNQEGEEDLYDTAKTALDGMDKLLGRAARAKAWLGGSSLSFNETEYSVSRLFVRFEPDADKYIQAGGAFMSFSKESDTIVFEDQIKENDDQMFIKPEFFLAYRIPWIPTKPLWVKAGLLEGKPGGALTFKWDEFHFFQHSVELHYEVRDAYNDLNDEDIDENISGPMQRIYFKTAIYPKSDAWYGKILHSIKAFAGISRLQDDPEFVAGIGFEYEEEDIRTLIGLMAAGS